MRSNLCFTIRKRGEFFKKVEVKGAVQWGEESNKDLLRFVKWNFSSYVLLLLLSLIFLLLAC